MNWLWKKLGYHVCEDFTAWETVRAVVTVIPCVGNVPILSMQHDVVREWQERRCVECGKTHRD